MSLRDRFASAFGRVPESSSAAVQRVDVGRHERDAQVVATYLPPGTAGQVVEGIEYWVFDIKCELGNPYSMAAYFDGREYQVKVLHPDVTGKYSVHDGHLFSDGRICLNPPANGAESLQDAYAKAVVWASGFSVMRHTGQFPFSLNNQGG